MRKRKGGLAADPETREGRPNPQSRSRRVRRAVVVLAV